MDAIEALMSEHRNIERALNALDSYAVLVRAGDVTERGDLGRFIRFLREYADRLHHGKEEDVLFAQMVQAGFPRDGGPIAVMLSEHDEGRALVREMRELSERPGAWSPEDARGAADAACRFSELLRAHIHKEDRILYPMAERHLPAEVMATIGAEVQRRMAGDGGTERELLALVDELESRWVTARRPGSLAANDVAEADPVLACGCGGHHREERR